MKINTKRILSLALISGFAVSLTGCGGSNGSSASDCNQIAIAAVGPYTGADNASGRPARNAAELAVSQFNAKYPECPIGLVAYDTQGNPDNAANLADGLVADKRIVGVVGPSFSGETAAMMPAFEKGGLPSVNGSATNPDLTKQGWRTFHRSVGSDATQGPAAGVYIVTGLGAKRVAVIDDTGLYGKTNADLTAKQIKALGAEVPLRTNVDPESVDYSAAVASLKAANIDAIYFGGVSAAAARLIRQARDAGITAPFVGGDGLNSLDFVNAPGGASVGAAFTCPCILADPPTGKRQIAFAKAYEEAYGATPGLYTAEFYDSANMILNAIKDGYRTRSGIQNWLKTASFKGITKQIEFDKTGEVKAGSIFVFEVTPEGELKQVAQIAGEKIVK